MRFGYDSYFRYICKSHYMLRRTIVQELHIQIFILSSSSVSNGISYCFVSFSLYIMIFRLQLKTLLLSYCFFFTMFLVKHFHVVCHSLKFQLSIYTHGKTKSSKMCLIFWPKLASVFWLSGQWFFHARRISYAQSILKKLYIFRALMVPYLKIKPFFLDIK